MCSIYSRIGNDSSCPAAIICVLLPQKNVRAGVLNYCLWKKKKRHQLRFIQFVSYLEGQHLYTQGHSFTIPSLSKWSRFQKGCTDTLSTCQTVDGKHQLKSQWVCCSQSKQGDQDISLPTECAKRAACLLKDGERQLKPMSPDRVTRLKLWPK